MQTFFIIPIVVCFLWLVLIIFSGFYYHKLINCLRENGISVNSLATLSVYRKFKLFLENCNDVNNKVRYVQLFRRAVLFEVIAILYFLSLIALCFFLL